MASCWHFGLFAFLFLISPCFGLQCSPKSVSRYSTSNAILESESTFLAAFQLDCNGEDKPDQLHAIIDDKPLPLARDADGNTFEVSWVEDHKAATTGVYKVAIYDDASFAAYRKAKRSGNTFNGSPLFTIDMDHKVATKQGLWLQTEFIAVVGIILIWWYASNIKSKLHEL
ncbi:Translocon-associated protein subunit delta [Trichoplax sp. H2]|nr:Translocon-associated protein subunit delta [Trichoplax sp. H2]|eukprot:RDD38441.1 Translocon-associated protein subunit delta [Trichoplax sp. H2]